MKDPKKEYSEYVDKFADLFDSKNDFYSVWNWIEAKLSKARTEALQEAIDNFEPRYKQICTLQDHWSLKTKEDFSYENGYANGLSYAEKQLRTFVSELEKLKGLDNS